MRFWYVVEGEDSPPEFEEKVCAEGDESPEWKLVALLDLAQAILDWAGLYNRDNLFLDLLRQ